MEPAQQQLGSVCVHFLQPFRSGHSKTWGLRDFFVGKTWGLRFLVVGLQPWVTTMKSVKSVDTIMYDSILHGQGWTFKRKIWFWYLIYIWYVQNIWILRKYLFTRHYIRTYLFWFSCLWIFSLNRNMKIIHLVPCILYDICQGPLMHSLYTLTSLPSPL